MVGKTLGDTVTFRGEPIVYALSIPKHPPHPGLAERFAAFLLSPEGRRVLTAEKLDLLDSPILAGSGAPPAVARQAAGSR